MLIREILNFECEARWRYILLPIFQAQTGNPQALAIMDLIIQDLAKIDQFHHNYEMMTHGETTQHAKRDFYDALMN